jgi:hypothetical protein
VGTFLTAITIHHRTGRPSLLSEPLNPKGKGDRSIFVEPQGWQGGRQEINLSPFPQHLRRLRFKWG